MLKAIQLHTIYSGQDFMPVFRESKLSAPIELFRLYSTAWYEYMSAQLGYNFVSLLVLDDPVHHSFFNWCTACGWGSEGAR